MLTRPEVPQVTGSEPSHAVFSALAIAGMPYSVVRHADLAGPVRSAADVARLLGIDPSRITKTLLVTEDPGRRRCALAVLSTTSRADLGAVADALGWCGAVLASAHQLADQLGQPAYGVSPIGSDLPVLVDPALATAPDVLVGSGTAGVEVGIDIYSLVAITNARWAPVGESGTGPAGDRRRSGGTAAFADPH